MASTLVLRCLNSPLFRLCVERTVTILGRSSGCDLVVDDPSISRKHAEIRIRHGRLFLKDLQSRNGTFVDGQPIQATEVAQGQVVRFGNISFTVQADDEVEPRSDDKTGGPARNKAPAPSVDFTIVWDPKVVSPGQYADLVAAIGDVVRAAGGAGVQRIAEQSFGVPAGKAVPT